MTAWLLWMLVACLSDGAATRCSVQPTITSSKQRKVIVSCPPIGAGSEQLKYLLLINNSYVTQKQLEREPDSGGSVFSGQFEVTANNSGMYVCRMEVLYPPPYREHCHSTEVKLKDLFVEKEPDLAVNSTTPAANQSCPGRSPFIPEVVMYAACGVFLVYSLTISCVAIVTWRKLKNHEEDTSVYMNTRPGDIRKPYKA